MHAESASAGDRVVYATAAGDQVGRIIAIGSGNALIARETDAAFVFTAAAAVRGPAAGTAPGVDPPPADREPAAPLPDNDWRALLPTLAVGDRITIRNHASGGADVGTVETLHAFSVVARINGRPVFIAGSLILGLAAVEAVAIEPALPPSRPVQPEAKPLASKAAEASRRPQRNQPSAPVQIDLFAGLPC